ncbi:MAG TPA: DUF72 domain-containing protein [Burkholderiales bacterium]|nr:DUF72 domain-containing protein [Burkholderiales bacterium]
MAADRPALAAPRQHAAGAVRIGISGWRYARWRGVFYPKGLAQSRELKYASRTFSSIEINGTFYRLQRPELFDDWAAATPDDFVFALKGSRFITHMKRLKDPEPALARFFASGPLQLGEKLGPIVWQLPPTFKFDAPRLEAFFKTLPRDTHAALALAGQAPAVRGRRFPVPRRVPLRPLRHAVEIRHESFRTPEFTHLLRSQHVALCCADTVEWPRLMDVTADFIYCRLHGSKVLYASGYGEKALKTWARRVVAWARGGEPEDAERATDRPAPKRKTRDVYVYFDNDAKVRAPVDARRLAELVGVELG